MSIKSGIRIRIKMFWIRHTGLYRHFLYFDIFPWSAIREGLAAGATERPLCCILFMFSFQCTGLYSQTTYDCFLCVCLGHGGGELHGDLQREGPRPAGPHPREAARAKLCSYIFETGGGRSV